MFVATQRKVAFRSESWILWMIKDPVLLSTLYVGDSCVTSTPMDWKIKIMALSNNYKTKAEECTTACP